MSSISISDYLNADQADRCKGKRDNGRYIRLFADSPLSAYGDISVTDSHRSQLVDSILSDLTSDLCAWDIEDRLSVLRVIKELSRLPGSSESLASLKNLSSTLSLARRESAILFASPAYGHATSLSTTPIVAGESLDLLLRTLNNTLLQHPYSRDSFVSPSLGGVAFALDVIEVSDSATLIFLAARLVFFSTLFQADITKMAVEDMRLVDIFSQRTNWLMEQVLASHTPELDLALTELQKAFFNIGLYYPRLASGRTKEKAVAGEAFDEALLPFLAPTIHLVNTHPGHKLVSLTAPITNAVAVLLNFPVRSYKLIWSQASSRLPSKKSSKCSDEVSPSGRSSSTSRARRIATSLLSKASSSNGTSKAGIVSTSGTGEAPGTSSISRDIICSLLDLLEEFLSTYFASQDIDDPATTISAQRDGLDLEENAGPTILLCRRLADEVEDFRLTMKMRILPADIDRSQGLDKRTDLTGILIGLMSSTMFPTLARASGELLLALCDGEAAKMTGEIGYGPCAGFLMNTGRIHSLPSAPTSNGSGRPIDPITGQVLPTEEEMKLADQTAGLRMTEEEKEAEAERLFSLFDRLDRTGVVKVQNPMTQQVENGKIRELEERQEEEERIRMEDEERKLETTVEREMKAFREKQKRERRGP